MVATQSKTMDVEAEATEVVSQEEPPRAVRAKVMEVVVVTVGAEAAAGAVAAVDVSL